MTPSLFISLFSTSPPSLFYNSSPILSSYSYTHSLLLSRPPLPPQPLALHHPVPHHPILPHLPPHLLLFLFFLQLLHHLTSLPHFFFPLTIYPVPTFNINSFPVYLLCFPSSSPSVSTDQVTRENCQQNYQVTSLLVQKE